MKTFFRIPIVAALAALVAIPASASQLRFDVLEARFYDPVSGNVLAISNSFADPATIAWGQNGLTPLVNSSGYSFDAANTPLSAEPLDTFALGTFTHFNQPITAGTAITSVKMDVRGTISAVDGLIETLIGDKTFSFGIAHNETTNAAPCVQPSVSVCDDFVNISTLSDSDVFQVGGVIYTLNILGFATSVANAEAGIFSPFFGSPEGGNNTRVLAASFNTQLPPPPPPVVPLPAAGWLLLGAVGALGGMKRFAARKAV